MGCSASPRPGRLFCDDHWKHIPHVFQAALCFGWAADRPIVAQSLEWQLDYVKAFTCLAMMERRMDYRTARVLESKIEEHINRRNLSDVR